MQVQLFATLRDLLGTSAVEFDAGDGTTVRDILQRLCERYPQISSKLWDGDGQLGGEVKVLLNGRMVQFLDGLDTPVGPSDSLLLFPPVGGG